MHNWRFLLLAFLAVLQPIASFTERNFVDGREQCTDRNNLLRDSRLLYGKFRTNKLPEDHRLERVVERVDRRYEVRDSLLTRPPAERRDLTEYRSAREDSRHSPTSIDYENRRERTFDQRRLYRDVHRISSRDISRDLRTRDVARDFDTRQPEIRQQESRDRAFSDNRGSRDNNRITRNVNNEERRSRISMDSKREERENTRERRQIQENREASYVLRRARDDVASRETIASRAERRISERTAERRARSESRLQIDNKQKRQSLERTREIGDDLRQSRDARLTDRMHSRREESRVDDRRQQRESTRATLDKQLVRRERSLGVRRENQQIYRSRTTDSKNIQLRRFDARSEVRMGDRRFRETREIRESIDRVRNTDPENTQLELTDARREANLNKRINFLKGSEGRPSYTDRDTDSERNDARREVKMISQIRESRERRTREFIDRFRNTELGSSRLARSDARRETRTSDRQYKSPEERREIRNTERNTRLEQSQAQREQKMSDRRFVSTEEQKAIRNSVDRIRNTERTELRNARRETRVSDRRYQTREVRRETTDSSRHNENKNTRSERFAARRETRMGDGRFQSLNERRDTRESVDRTERTSRLARFNDIREVRSDVRRNRVHENRADLEDRRVDSQRTMNNEVQNMERSDRRSLDRFASRDTRSRSPVSRERSVFSERNDFRTAHAPSILRNLKTLDAHIRVKTQPDESPKINWQHALYALQCVYLCGVLMQILSPKENVNKKQRGLAWWMTPRSLLKVD